MEKKLECGVCDTRLYDEVEREGRKSYKKNAEYHEVDVTLSDLTGMTVGVCSEHLHPTKFELLEMTDRMHDGWREEVLLGVGNPEWVTNTGLSLQVVGVKS